LQQSQKPLEASDGLNWTSLLPGELGEKVMRQHEIYRLNVEYQKVLHEVQLHPELEEFLHLPEGMSSLIEYAQEGPIIIVNESEFRSDAGIVTTNGLDSFPLQFLEKREMEEMEKRYAEALSLMSTSVTAATKKLDQVLEWLWDIFAEPILEHLGFDGKPAVGEDLPRTWWIATGRLSIFPFHAAGNQKEGSLWTVLDRTVPSYINGLRVLGYTRSRRCSAQQDHRPQADNRALLFSMETTPGMGKIKISKALYVK
jgi:hypothetical protein